MKAQINCEIKFQKISLDLRRCDKIMRAQIYAKMEANPHFLHPIDVGMEIKVPNEIRDKLIKYCEKEIRLSIEKSDQS